MSLSESELRLISSLKQPLFGFPQPTARAPFNRSLADVVIRSSDKVEFYLSKVVLILASSFFEDMFSPENLTHPSQRERHIIDIPEDSHALDPLFRFCYPVDNPSINDLATLDQVLAAAIKYDVQVAVNALSQIMDRFLASQPMEVYKLACSHKQEHKAFAAVVACRQRFTRDDGADDFSKTTPGVAFVPEMCGMTAGSRRQSNLFDCRKYNDVLDIANRLGMEPLIDAIRADWGKGAETSEDLLGAYLIAARLDWFSEAEVAAERLQTRPLATVYSRELERTPATLYHALLEYHHRCQSAIRKVWKAREYSSPYRRGNEWDKEWYTQSITGTHTRFIPTVVVEAVSIKTSAPNLRDMVETSRAMDDETKTALKVIKLKTNLP